MGKNLETGPIANLFESSLQATEIHVDRDEFLYRKGSPIRPGHLSVYRVDSGLLGSVTKRSNRIYFQEVYPSGSLIGEEDWGEAEHKTTVIALKPSIVTAVNVPFITANLLDLVDYMSRRIENTQEKIDDSLLVGTYNKRQLILRTALDYYRSEGPLLTQEQIAKVVGSDRETVNKILRGFAQERVIELMTNKDREHWMEVIDEERVKAILNSEK